MLQFADLLLQVRGVDVHPFELRVEGDQAHQGGVAGDEALAELAGGCEVEDVSGVQVGQQVLADFMVREDMEDLVVLEELGVVEGLQSGHVVELEAFLELRDDGFLLEQVLVEARDCVAVLGDLGPGLLELHLEALGQRSLR